MAAWIKICGITNLDDAVVASDAGAGALGFNFFQKSRRYVEPRAARQIVVELPASVLKVGVFVNHEADEIAAIADLVGLNAVQLHGDEPPSILTKLPTHLRVLRAHRCGTKGLEPLARHLDECHALGRMPDAVLIDADAGAEFGGSGQLTDWAAVHRQKHLLDGLPFLLAGGLTCENVAAAIAAVEPHGVDVASGVESSPGKKDQQLVERFIAQARQAFLRLDS